MINHTNLYHTFVYKSRRSLVYHQFQRNCISSTHSVVSHQTAGKYTLTSDDIQPIGLMIYECISRHRRVIHSMIYQTCGLDKKSRIKMIRLFWCGRRDLNPYVGNTRPSNVRVCRFRHSREHWYYIILNNKCQ